LSIVETWDLSRGVGSTGEPRVALFFDETSGVSDFSPLTVAHFITGNWENEGTGGTTGTVNNGTITSLNNFITFSPITLATTDNDVNPLPVELLYFKGGEKEGIIELTWATASELDNDRFEIERSSDGVVFNTIGSVAGMGTSDEQNEYDFEDSNALFGFNFYRLKQIDFSGEFEYSDIILVDHSSEMLTFDAVLYPNSTDQNNINLDLSLRNESSLVQIRIYDNAGRVYYQQGIEPEELRTQLKLPIAGYTKCSLQRGNLSRKAKYKT